MFTWDVTKFYNIARLANSYFIINLGILAILSELFV